MKSLPPFPDLNTTSIKSKPKSTYTEEQIARVVEAWLFGNKSHQKIDVEILDEDISSRGHYSYIILDFLGLKKEHKSFFAYSSHQEALANLEEKFAEEHENKQKIKTIIKYIKILSGLVAQLCGKGERSFRLAEEVPDDQKLLEGSVCQVTINSYERNPEARKLCIQHYGTSCCICGFNFEKKFGSVAQGFIHVHHLKPLSEIQKEYEVDPIADLRPVCPNCHAIIHLGGKTRSIEEVKSWCRN
ncbi:HNH endonuclease [Synechocystis salina]|uniref:HNH endonuclease n=1 Tax=Synechocystis salina LEGE 00031 TaxID=1828736 RepID=A0ABR9VWH3_9SYNC|nr:HNH endonuclease [Synechocystis salina]MBE9242719.1 HNH endonuclease [Synechocystis salina LEGE 00041]MBE9255717.1 HNH endonuclease [Synechocystis salina LEGE 00031]